MLTPHAGDSRPRIRLLLNSGIYSWIWLVLLPGILPGCQGQDREREVVSTPPARPAGIVIILTDDQGYGDLGVTGNPVLETPRIDALAAASATTSRFYVSPVCTPTRASLLTGRYNYRTRAIDTYAGRAMMDTGEVTLAELLKPAGYRTGIFGKWHLGDCHPLRPVDQGFDESLIHRGGGLAQPSEPRENERRYTDAILFRNGEAVETKGYCTDVYFDAALDFIRESRREGRPFLALIPTNAPHGPFHDVPEELYQKYRQKDLGPLGANPRHHENIARVFAMVENIDQNVGRLLDGLEELGLEKETIVIYLHDNGPQMARYVGNMVGTKTQVREGGIRTPFYVRWPARLAAGRVADRTGAHIDVLPTLLEATGVRVPEGLAIDGRSLLPFLEGKTRAWEPRTLFIQAHRGDRPVLHHHFAAIGPRYKLLRSSGFGRETPPESTPFELYDLLEDPREQVDLSASKPEILAKMKAEYEAWFRDVSSTREDNYAPPRIVVGTDHELETCLTWQDWRRLDGKGWGQDGEWWLRFVGDHRYEVEVLTREPLENVQVRLFLGGKVIEREFEGAHSTWKLEDFRPAAGPAKLRVRLRTPDGERPPYHVILRRS